VQESTQESVDKSVRMYHKLTAPSKVVVASIWVVPKGWARMLGGSIVVFAVVEVEYHPVLRGAMVIIVIMPCCHAVTLL
jgi:hypothetical protein